MKQLYYLRMGQGCTGWSGSRTKLEDTVTSSIPGPDSEPAVTHAMPGTITFDEYADDDIGDARRCGHVRQSDHLARLPLLPVRTLCTSRLFFSYFINVQHQ